MFGLLCTHCVGTMVSVKVTRNHGSLAMPISLFNMNPIVIQSWYPGEALPWVQSNPLFRVPKLFQNLPTVELVLFLCYGLHLVWDKVHLILNISQLKILFYSQRIQICLHTTLIEISGKLFCDLQLNSDILSADIHVTLFLLRVTLTSLTAPLCS